MRLYGIQSQTDLYFVTVMLEWIILDYLYKKEITSVLNVVCIIM